MLHVRLRPGRRRQPFRITCHVTLLDYLLILLSIPAESQI